MIEKCYLAGVIGGDVHPSPSPPLPSPPTIHRTRLAMPEYRWEGQGSNNGIIWRSDAVPFCQLVDLLVRAGGVEH